jgi:hypothetical protein
MNIIVESVALGSACLGTSIGVWAVTFVCFVTLSCQPNFSHL